MTTRLKATYSDNPRVRPLADGTVRPEGFEIDWDITGSPDYVVRHIRENPFDLFEYSLAGYTVARESGVAARLGWTALPVFFAKPFVMFDGFLATDGSGIRGLGDLRGKRIGVPEYRMTAGVWLRIILRELYGIAPREITWTNNRPMFESYMAELGAPPVVPADVRVEDAPAGVSYADLLRAGTLDAAFGDRSLAALGAADGVRPFLDLEARHRIFADLFTKAGASPVNHVVVVKEGHLRGRPDLARSLYEAFERSKQEAYERVRRAAAGYLLFPERAFAEQAAIFSDDPYPSGVRANRRTLDLLMDQLVDDGQITRRPDIDTLFADGVRDT
jgi:4,5-dihydroxyphthalate decarboxylase